MRTQTYQLKLAAKTPELLARRQVDQCGAICWRIGDQSAIEVLLVTSRDTGRWVIPKGNIDKKEQLHRCAQREAFEEAGVEGKIWKKALGYYTYVKDTTKPPFVVSVFPLLVESEVRDFKERNERMRNWFTISEAASCVEEPELKGLFRLIAEESAPKYFRKAIEKQADRLLLRTLGPTLST